MPQEFGNGKPYRPIQQASADIIRRKWGTYQKNFGLEVDIIYNKSLSALEISQKLAERKELLDAYLEEWRKS